MKSLVFILLVHSAFATHFVFDTYLNNQCDGRIVTTLAVIANECLQDEDASGYYNCTSEAQGLVGYDSTDCSGTAYPLFGTGCDHSSQLSTQLRCGTPTKLKNDYPYTTITEWRDSTCSESQVSVFQGYLDGCALRDDGFYGSIQILEIDGEDQIVFLHCTNSDCTEACVTESVFKMGTCSETFDSAVTGPGYYYMANSGASTLSILCAHLVLLFCIVL